MEIIPAQVSQHKVMEVSEEFPSQIVDNESGFFEMDYSDEGENNLSDEGENEYLEEEENNCSDEGGDCYSDEGENSYSDEGENRHSDEGENICENNENKYLAESENNYSGESENNYSDESENNSSDEDDKGDDFIESNNASNFFIQTDKSFLKVGISSQKINDSKIMKTNSDNSFEDETTIRKVPNSSESHLQSESLLDKFETFFNNFSNDNDEKQINDMPNSKTKNLINADINEEDEYYSSKTDKNYEQKNASEGNSTERERFFKWSIKSCKVSLKKIKSENKTIDSDFSASGYEVSGNETETKHEKYLLDINQNESFASLWKMHLGKFSGGFNCNSCIDIFSRKNDLRNHQKKYHPNKATKNVFDLGVKISVNENHVPNDIIRNQYEKETNDIQEETNIIKDQVLNENIKKPYEMETNEIEVETDPIKPSLENSITVNNSTDRTNTVSTSTAKAAKCDFCEKEYGRRPGNLKKHLLLHKCQLCNINFSGSTWKKDLSSHKKSQHRDNENTLNRKDNNENKLNKMDQDVYNEITSNKLCTRESELAPSPKRIRLN